MKNTLRHSLSTVLGSLASLVVLVVVAAPPMSVLATENQSDPAGAVQNALSSQSMVFIPNEGQWNDEVFFMAQGGPMSVWFTTGGWTFTVEEVSTDPETGRLEREAGVAVKMAFEGSRKSSRPVGEGTLQGTRNFLQGSNPSRWATNVPAYERIRFPELYPGIDLVARNQDGHLEYDLVAQPGAAIEKVQVRCEGAEGLSVDPSGVLVMETALGPVTQKAPITWNELPNGEKVRVNCSFKSKGPQRFGFHAPSRRRDLHLVIDPGLEWATYLGSADGTVVQSIETTDSGDVIVAGFTSSSGFPTTVGAYDPHKNAGHDGFVARFTGDGSQLIFATFLGGMGHDVISDLALSPSGDIVVGGHTSSNDFPTTPGCSDATFAGGYLKDTDGFVAQISASGSSLISSSYLGGLGDDGVSTVGVDDLGAMVVGGWTGSSDFPVVGNPMQAQFGGMGGWHRGDAFVARMAPNGDQLEWSTYLGGAYDEDLTDLAVDASGQVTVVGWTESTDFPLTPGSHDVTVDGWRDAFAVKISNSGQQMLWGTVVGGQNFDQANALDLASDGSVLIGGSTSSADFPTTSNGADVTFGGGNNGDGFVVELAHDGSAIHYGSYVGGSGSDEVVGIATDGSGGVVVAGGTYSSDFDVTAEALDTTTGFQDSFLLWQNLSTGVTNYGTLLGGSASDNLRAMCLAENGMVHLGGYSTSADFPVTAGAYETTFGGVPSFTAEGFMASLDVGVNYPMTTAGSWVDLGGGLAGGAITAPELAGLGAVVPGASGSIDMIGANPFKPGVLYLGVERMDEPFKGGVMVPRPLPSCLLFFTSAVGTNSVPYAWPNSSPSGFEVFLQAWVIDETGPVGLVGSNALSGQVL